MKTDHTDHSYSWGSSFIDRHPVMANLFIILIISGLGIYAAYLATALFTKHGRSVQVPGVENMTYTEAISRLHDRGLKVDIRDSLYRDDVKPGYVIEQFPRAKSIVKPGRKIFLYINAVHPKQVVLDDDNHPNELAMRGVSQRQALAKFEELGFKNVRVVKVLGSSDRVVKILANGHPVRKTQKVAVNSSIVIKVADGRLRDVEDSLSNLEYLDNYRASQAEYGNSSDPGADAGGQFGGETGQPDEPGQDAEEPNPYF